MAKLLLVISDLKGSAVWAGDLPEANGSAASTNSVAATLINALPNHLAIVLDGAVTDRTHFPVRTQERKLPLTTSDFTLFRAGPVEPPSSRALHVQLELERTGTERLCRAIDIAMYEQLRPPTAEGKECLTRSHAAVRWARMVVQGVNAQFDPQSLHRWSREIGISYGALRNWCRTAHLSAKHSLSFTRLLRAVILRQTDGRRFEDILDVVDLRTLRKLLTRGGLDTCDTPAGDVGEAIARFLSMQRLIVDTEALTAVRALLDQNHGAVVDAAERLVTPTRHTSVRALLCKDDR